MDKNKILDAAAKLVAKGAYDKAIKEYQKVLEADPRDVRVLHKLGELYEKKNDNVQSAVFFTRVADGYATDGFSMKAIALYKKVLKLDPNLIEVNLKLAELHQQHQLMSEAMAYFQAVANHHDKNGNVRASLDILKKMVELDPENVASRIKLADLYAREHMNQEAAGEYKRAADYLKRNNRVDDYLRVAERLSTLEPNNLELARDLAQEYLGRADQKRALAKLQLCFKADPRDVQTLTLLAQAFQGLGQTSKTISVYKELARLYADTHRADEANKTWATIAELDPNDPEVKARATTRNQPATPAPAPAPAFAPQPQRPAAPQYSAPVAPAPAPAPTPPAPSALSRDQLAKLLTETDVYVKYGLHDKALEHLRRVFAVDPENLDAHEKAYNIYVAADNSYAAAEQLLNVLRLCTRGQEVQRAQPYLATILQQNPNHPEVPAFLAVLRTARTAEPDFGTEQPGEMAEEALLVDSDDEEVIVADAPEDALAHEQEFVFTAAPGAGEIVEEEEVLEEPALVPDEAPEPAWADDEPLAMAAASVDEPLTYGAPTAAEEIVVEEPELDDEEPATAVSPLEPPVGDEPAGDEPAGEECDEAQFFLDQGLTDEAREILETVLIAFPGHVRAQQLQERLEALEAAGVAEAAPEDVEDVAESAKDAFDLAAELADELDELGEDDTVSAGGGDDYQVSVDEVFSEFKKGLEKIVKPEDVDTHYDLGIAYKEMGLFEDAIGEFTVARQGCVGRKKELDCLTMIGLLQLQKGDALSAVDAFKQALASEHAVADTAKALRFELAAAWESAGSPGKALFHFQAVASQDPKFRDVAENLRRLTALARPEEDALTAAGATRNGAHAGKNGAPAKATSGGSTGAQPPAKPGARTGKVGYV